MRIKISLKKSCCSGETIGQDISVYLHNCYCVYDVIETIRHEELHAMINKFAKTSARQDHFIIKLMDIESF